MNFVSSSSQFRAASLVLWDLDVYWPPGRGVEVGPSDIYDHKGRPLTARRRMRDDKLHDLQRGSGRIELGRVTW
eukprot:9804565-Heterocapsa_arctica.AAC.1